MLIFSKINLAAFYDYKLRKDFTAKILMTQIFLMWQKTAYTETNSFKILARTFLNFKWKLHFNKNEKNMCKIALNKQEKVQDLHEDKGSYRILLNEYKVRGP